MEIAIRRNRAARPERAMQDTVRLTVGFVDLVGYTRLSQQLDARALGALVGRFEALASDAVAARDGRVVKLVGDVASCCDACGGTTCPTVTTTTTPTGTTMHRTTTTRVHTSTTSTTTAMCAPNGRTCTTSAQCCSQYCYLGTCY